MFSLSGPIQACFFSVNRKPIQVFILVSTSTVSLHIPGVCSKAWFFPWPAVLPPCVRLLTFRRRSSFLLSTVLWLPLSEGEKWWNTGHDERPAKTSTTFHGTLPYIKGTSERIRSVLREVGVHVHVAFKSFSTIKSSLLRKRPEKAKALSVVYCIPCGADNCSWSYVGESGLLTWFICLTIAAWSGWKASC